jgi:hypothetical protein
MRSMDLLANMMPRSFGLFKPISFQLLWFLNLMIIWLCMSLGTHYWTLWRMNFAPSLTQYALRQRGAHFGIRISNPRSNSWRHGCDHHGIQFCRRINCLPCGSGLLDRCQLQFLHGVYLHVACAQPGSLSAECFS